MSALDRTDVQYAGATATDRLGVTGYASPYGGIGYYVARLVESPTCTRLRANLYSCVYDREIAYKAASDSIWGSVMVLSLTMQGGKVARKTHTFQKVGGSWTSPSFAQATREWVQNQSQKRGDDNEKRAQQKRDYDFQERERKFRECQARSPFETCYL